MITRDASADLGASAPSGSRGCPRGGLLRRERLAVASLRFEPHATIEEHAASFEIDVICIEEQGFVSVGDQTFAFRSGQRVVWPALVNHRLWTDVASMQTLMLEHR